MTNRSRARWSLFAALAAHALAVAWTALRTPASPRRDHDARETMSVEIAVLAPSVVEAPAPSEPPRAEPSPPAVATRALPPSATRGASTPEPSSPRSAPSDAPPPVASAETGAGGSWTFSPTQPGATAAGGSEGANAATMNKATAAGVGAVLDEWSRKAEDRKRKPRIFTPRDMELGLVPGGQFVPITRDRVRDSLVPPQSHALLEFWADSRGIVARVRVIHASSDERAWQDAADRLVEDAHGTFPLKVPSNADGLIVTLDVTSVLKTLSGAAGSASTLSRVLGAVVDPVDAVMDAKAAPRRIVAAKVVGVEAF
jgi:hypothetical protein